MKYFNVVANFVLNKKPKWLDGFRKRFDQKYPYHITLKTNSVLEKGTEQEVEKVLKGIANTTKPMRVVFDGLRCEGTSKGDCFMIFAKPNKELELLQQEISEKLERFGKNVSAEYEKFEKNFQPHITIARGLSKMEAVKAKQKLGEDLHCEADVNELTLTFVEEIVFEQWSDPKRKTHFKLGNEKI